MYAHLILNSLDKMDKSDYNSTFQLLPDNLHISLWTVDMSDICQYSSIVCKFDILTSSLTLAKCPAF